MTTEILETEPVSTDGDDGDEVQHFWCCDPDMAHCGRDLTGAVDVDSVAEPMDVCIVCVDLQPVDAESCAVTCKGPKQ